MGRERMWVFIAIIAVIVLGVAGVLIWFFKFRDTSDTKAAAAPPTGAKALSAYKASAALGDFLELTVDTTAATITYTNVTNGVSGTDVAMTTDSDGFITFGADANLATGVEVPGSVFIFHTKTAGKTKDKKGFALGLSVKPYTEAAFPAQLMNYMQFRTNNGGFEVGFIDARTDTLTHQYFAPSACWDNGGTGAIADGVGEPSAFPLDATAFTMSDDKTYITKTFAATTEEPENTVTIFQTETNDVVIDMDNGSIFAFKARADDTLPSGAFTGLLFGRDDAQAMQGNTETGTDLLTRLRVVFTGAEFTWAEDGKELFAGTAVPLNTEVTMDGGRKMFGAFTCRVVDGTATTDLVFVLSDDAKLLCAQYTNRANDPTYAYRHGACKQDT